jgi:hypothetical protein
LKMTSCITMSKRKKSEKSEKPRFYGQTSFLAPCPSILGQFQPHGFLQELQRKYKKNEFKTHFEQNFTMDSYGVGI